MAEVPSNDSDASVRGGGDGAAFWRPATAIFALAFVVRALYLFELRSTPYFAVPVGDGEAFDAWAQDLASGSWLGAEVFYQAPAYPHLLGLVYTLFGRDVFLVRLGQAVLGALACCLVADAGRRFFDRATGITAGVLLALYAPAIFFDGLIKKVALATFLTALLLALLARQLDRPRGGGLLASGLCLGVLAMTRENARVLLPIVAAWLVVGFKDVALRTRLAWVATLVVGFGAVLVPVGLRNQAAAGELVFGTTNFGTNLYIGNNPDADGFYLPLRHGRGHPEFERVDATEIAEAAEGRSLSATEVSDHWRDRALRWMAAEPAAALGTVPAQARVPRPRPRVDGRAELRRPAGRVDRARRPGARDALRACSCPWPSWAWGSRGRSAGGSASCTPSPSC